MATLNKDSLQIELSTEERIALELCISCGEKATRTGNTLCQKCWYNAEGEND